MSAVLEPEIPVATQIQSALATTPKGKTFLVSPDGRLSWGELSDHLHGVLTAIRLLELRPGDRVMIGTGNEINDSCLFLGCLLAGVTAILVDRKITPVELERLVTVARPTVAWLCPEHRSLDFTRHISVSLPRREEVSAGVIQAVHSTSESIAAIVFTSGTTLLPKGVQISHRALSAQMDSFRIAYGFDSNTRLLNLLPLHHVDGLFRGLVAAAVHGAELHRPAPFSIQGLPALGIYLRRTQITHFIVVPSILALIVRGLGKDCATFACPDLRYVISSADVLDANLWRQSEEIFHVPVINSWGQSETVCDALYALPNRTNSPIGTIGKPIGCEARIVDSSGSQAADGVIGELQIRGAIVMSGYLGQPEETNSTMDGEWLRTGDIAVRDENGVYRYIGRHNRIIVARGVSVHPENIVAALLTSKDVIEAAAVGVPNAEWGERIVACVVAAPESKLDSSKLFDLCRKTLSPEKRPQSILFFPELPRGPSGKVRIDDLLQMIAERNTEIRQVDLTKPSVYQVAASCFHVQVDELSPTSSPFNTTDWDSFGHINFIEELEKVYGITLTAEDIVNLACLGDAEKIVALHLAGHDRTPAGFA